MEGRGEFFRALDDDFGTPEAFAALFEMVRGINRAIAAGLAGTGQLREARHELIDLLDCLGLGGIDPGPAAAVPDEVMELVERRAGGARRPGLQRRRRTPGSRSWTGFRDHRHGGGPAGRAGVSAAPLRADGREVVYGRNPVRELLAARAREVHEVFALPQLSGEPWLEGVALTTSNRDQLGKLAGTSDHQGIVAVADPYPYAEPEDVLERPGPVVCLDGAQDPRNLGAITRVAEGAGAAGIIISKRGQPGHHADGGQGVGRRGRAHGHRPRGQHGELPARRARREAGARRSAPTPRVARTTASCPGRAT